MTTSKPTTRLRELLARPGIISMPGVHDCLMAKLVESSGFAGAFIGDGAVSVTRLGRPDFGYVDRGEVVDRAREVCRSTPLPVIVDVGTGYGAMQRVARELVENGIVSEHTRAGMTDLMRLSDFQGLRELYELEARYAHD